MFLEIKEFLLQEWLRNATLIGALCVAILSVWTSRSIARKKQAADLLFATRNDKELQAGFKTLKEYESATDKRVRCLLDKSEDDKERSSVLYVLNHFESVAIGVFNDIYDEKMLKEAWYSNLLKVYGFSEELINSAREKGQGTCYQEFESLALKWKQNPLKKKKMIKVK